MPKVTFLLPRGPSSDGPLRLCVPIAGGGMQRSAGCARVIDGRRQGASAESRAPPALRLLRGPLPRESCAVAVCGREMRVGGGFARVGCKLDLDLRAFLSFSRCQAPENSAKVRSTCISPARDPGLPESTPGPVCHCIDPGGKLESPPRFLAMFLCKCVNFGPEVKPCIYGEDFRFNDLPAQKVLHCFCAREGIFSSGPGSGSNHG